MTRKKNSAVEMFVPGAKTFDLHAAILVYRNRHSAETYATVHSINKERRTPVIGAGQPASAAAVRDLMASLNTGDHFNGFITDRMLYVGSRTAAWWRPPQRTRVFFHCMGEDTPKHHLGEVTQMVPLPGLVFALSAGRLYVFAVKGADRPGANTAIYRPPFFNMYESGAICEGNVERPTEVNAATLAAFERTFFESRFTHPNIRKGSDLTRYPGGPYKLWRAMLNVEWTPAPIEHHFPERTLVNLNTTAAQRLQQLDTETDDHAMPF